MTPYVYGDSPNLILFLGKRGRRGKEEREEGGKKEKEKRKRTFCLFIHSFTSWLLVLPWGKSDPICHTIYGTIIMADTSTTAWIIAMLTFTGSLCLKLSTG